MEISMIRRAFLALLLFVATPLPSQANDAEIRALLQTPGVHAIMRHALAPGGGDPDNFRVDDCSTQRNLDGRGRAQAEALGARLRDLGAAFNEIRTSQWCRCRDTAELLGLGPVVEAPELNSFFENRAAGPEQTAATRAYLRSLPKDQKVLMVTHQVNVTALIGGFPSSGELFLISLDESGNVEVVGSMLIDP